MKECSDKDHVARGRPFWHPWSMFPFFLYFFASHPLWTSVKIYPEYPSPPELADHNVTRYEIEVNYTAVMPDVPEIEELGGP